MSPKFTGVDVVVFGSSHVTERHHFPQEFNAIINSTNKYKGVTYFAQGGLKMTKDLVQKIKKEITKRGNKNTVFVFILGGNNLRKGNGKVEDVISCFREIASFAEAYERTRLVFSSLVPSPPHDSFSKEVFKQFNYQLRGLSLESGPTVYYFNIAKILTSKGIINSNFFKTNDVHLNIRGASLIAKNLGTLLRNIK